MITAVTMNPCIDRTLFLDRLIPEAHNVARHVRSDVSGKGINVNMVLKNLGVPTRALHFEFTRGGAPVGEFLAAGGIPAASVRVDAELRINTKVFDESRMAMTEINCRGPQLQPDAVQAFLDLFEKELDTADVLVATGSVPPGVPPDIYATMIQRANARSIPSLLDASGALLKAGVAAGPTLLKPNRMELETLIGRPVRTLKESVCACRALVDRGIGTVCLSMGGDGAVLVQDCGAWFSEGLDIRVRSFQGAGDSMAAGLCMALQNHLPGDEMLRSGVAAAHGSLIREGTLLCTRASYDRFLPLIPVRRL